jgi:hypothetical protein
MYYGWGWWWSLSLLLPMLLVLWAVLAWGPRRYGPSRHGYEPYPSGRADDAWGLAPSSRGWRKHHNVGPLNYRRTDVRIAEDVCDRLMVDDDIDPSSMEVRVENGEAILTGTVASRFEKRLAERIADSVPGVTDVQNQLHIGKRGLANQSRPTAPPT